MKDDESEVITYGDNKHAIRFIDKDGKEIDPVSTFDPCIKSSLKNRIDEAYDTMDGPPEESIAMIHHIASQETNAGIGQWLDPICNALYDTKCDLHLMAEATIRSLTKETNRILEEEEDENENDPRIVIMWIWAVGVHCLVASGVTVQMDYDNLKFRKDPPVIHPPSP